jgi:hypothetical protein
MKFNDALLKINLAVLTKYPSAQFYEAQGYLVPTDDETVDGTIDTAQFKAVYNYLDSERQKTIIGSFDDDLNVDIEVINDIWCEDVIMTPYVPMNADDAIRMIDAKIDEEIGEGPITLRHQLYPGEGEPRYFIGTLKKLHSIKVYTGEVDANAGE